MVFKKKNKKDLEENKDVETKEPIGNEEIEESKPSEEVVEKEGNYKDLYLRTIADFQNYKRRTEKERSEWIVDAQIMTIKPLLNVLDDLERAIEACKKQDSQEAKKVVEGLELAQKNIFKTFTDLGVEEIDCSGKFNPELHEAMLQVESDGHKSENIVSVLSKGYAFHGKVLRHAKVSVAK